jgi:cytochrome c
MRKFCRNLVVFALAAAASGLATSALLADEDADEEEDAAVAAQVAKEAMDRTVARGKELWTSKDLGKKTCASCHENPEKPKLNLATRQFSYPAYSRRKKAVVTMQQKINEMIVANSRGKALDGDSADLAALDAYVASLRAK